MVLFCKNAQAWSGAHPAIYSYPSSAEVKNDWSCTSTLSACARYVSLYCGRGNAFTFTSLRNLLHVTFLATRVFLGFWTIWHPCIYIYIFFPCTSFKNLEPMVASVMGIFNSPTVMAIRRILGIRWKNIRDHVSKTGPKITFRNFWVDDRTYDVLCVQLDTGGSKQFLCAAFSAV